MQKRKHNRICPQLFCSDRYAAGLGCLISAVPALWNATPIPLGSAEIKKDSALFASLVNETNSAEAGSACYSDEWWWINPSSQC